MQEIPVNTQALLEARTLVARDFMRVTARDRETGAPVIEGFWSDLGDVIVQVVDALSGEVVSHPFSGVGGLIAIDPIAMVNNLTVQTVDVTFSQLGDRINYLLRAYDLAQATVEIYRAEFDPETMVMVEPAKPRFVGYIDEAPVDTPEEGGEGSITLTCVSSVQEMTRANPETRGAESQRQRATGDAFYDDVTTVGDLVIFWGRPGSMRTSGA